jgi:hypothetical protein
MNDGPFSLADNEKEMNVLLTLADRFSGPGAVRYAGLTCVFSTIARPQFGHFAGASRR